MRACAEFERLFDALLAGELSRGEEAELRRHARSCGRCGRLLDLASLDVAAASGVPAAPEAQGAASFEGGAAEEAAQAFTRSVLARTSGSACEALERRLCDCVDGLLASGDAELVRGHLADCAPCATLERELRGLAADLPALAEIDPGPFFVRRVQAALAAEQAAARSPRAWVAARWRRALRRPRFAIEVAYSGALILALLTGVPGSPLHGVPEQALTLARGYPSLLDGIQVASDAAADAVPSLGEASSRPSLRIAESARGLSLDIVAVIQCSKPIGAAVLHRGRGILLSASQLDMVAIALEWERLALEVGQIWRTQGPPAK